MKNYYHIMNSKIHEEYGYDKIFEAIKIVYCNVTEKAGERHLCDTDLLVLKEKINSNVIHMLNRESHCTYQRLIKKREEEIEKQRKESKYFGEFIPNEKLLITKIDRSYIMNRSILNQHYIKI